MVSLELCTKENMSRMKRLYLSAFPDEERAPWWLLKRRARQGRAEMLAAVDGGFAGMAYMVTLGDMAYLFYLAVEDERRGQGIGGQILSLLRERYPDKRIFLAREQLDPAADNSAQRESRHRFYLANGFSDWDVRIRERDMVYDAMGVGEPVTAPEYKALMGGWAGKLLKRFFNAYIIE